MFKPIYIIAEIGTNYNGDLKMALNLVRAAKACGVDAVKLQIISADRSYAKKSESYAIFKKIEMQKGQWKQVVDLAKELGLECFATFTNPQDLNDYTDFHWPAYKISSTNVTNFPLLKAVAKQGKPVILSTGASSLKEVLEAVQFLEANGQNEMAILQCTSVYPASVEDVHLRVISTLRQTFPDKQIGFSDHSQGFVCAVAAVALGAEIIEKHFTLDRSMDGPDHAFSADPSEMKTFVDALRRTHKALGSGEKRPTPSELYFRDRLRRSLVALRNLRAGDILMSEFIGVKRSPIKGLEPKSFETVIGKRIKRDLLADDPITQDILE